jgi:hypothetical protein
LLNATSLLRNIRDRGVSGSTAVGLMVDCAVGDMRREGVCGTTLLTGDALGSCCSDVPSSYRCDLIKCCIFCELLDSRRFIGLSTRLRFWPDVPLAEGDTPKSNDGKLSSESSCSSSLEPASANDSPVDSWGVRGGGGVPKAGEESGVPIRAALRRVLCVGVTGDSVLLAKLRADMFEAIPGGKRLSLATKDDISPSICFPYILHVFAPTPAIFNKSVLV